jgi:hypothetical protein
MGDFQQAFEDERGLHQMVEMLEQHKSFNLVLTFGRGQWDPRKYIPHQVFPVLMCSPMREEFYYYWWRAVSSTYYVRYGAVFVDV